MKRFFYFLDEHILSVLSAILLVFIPLYPKKPLFDIIPGYIVRVRLEDFLIAITLVVYIIQVMRRKAIFWQTPLSKPILLYLFVGFLSVFSALFITHTVPLEMIHIGKLFLHFLRRIEYFSLFFIFFSSVKNITQLKHYFSIFFATVIGVTIYGYGQKYLYWPAYSTMNREFSKGWTLYLGEHARVMSTFGGHYDLAAFIMVALSFLWSIFFGLKDRRAKFITFIILSLTFWVIILTASRISFIAYIVSLTIVVFFWMYQRGLLWGLSRWTTAITLSLLIMLSFGDLSERFLRLFRLDERLGGIRSLLLKPAAKPPTDFISPDDEATSQVTSKSDQPPSLVKPGTYTNANGTPSDVTDEAHDGVFQETESDGSVKVYQKKRVYSKTALQFDLSTGIRLDVLWPRAWQGFVTNPFLGSGYSTLTKAAVTDFTEAESTDNGYLRSLGETGALGTIAFFAIIFTLLVILVTSLSGIKDRIFYALVAGGIASIVGLLINASYIDIFEASKIAYPFWSLSGVLLAGIVSEKESIEKNRKPFYISFETELLKQRLHSLLRNQSFYLLLILLLAFILRTHRLYEPLADWHSWRQADTSAVTRNFDRFGINLFYPIYDDLSSIASGRPNPNGYRMVEFPIYNAFSAVVKKILPELGVEVAGRLTSIFSSLISIVFLFLITRKYLGVRVAYLSSIIFSIIPYNIFYSRVILPEPMLVMTSLVMLYFFDDWISRVGSVNEMQESSIRRKAISFLLALIMASLALLIKPYALFLFLPLVYLVFIYKGTRGLFSPLIILFFLASIIPLALWRLWILHFPEGIPAYSWLLNGDGIRFKGAFFYWIFADRIGRLILGYWGLPLLIVGMLILHRSKAYFLFHIWFASILLYLMTFATGNVRHDYYQIMIIPIISIFVAIGLDLLLFHPPLAFNRWLSRGLGMVCVIFMVVFGWYHIRDFFNINHHEIVEAGKVVKELTHWKSKVIAPYGGDTAFLYQTERFGWPIMDGSLQDLIGRGAQYYVSVTDDTFTKELIVYAEKPDPLHPYKIIKRDPKFVLIQVVPDKYLPKD